MTNVTWEVFVYQGPVAPDGYGTLLAQVPGWSSLSFSPLGNAVGAGTISVPLTSSIFWQQGTDPETSPLLAYETLWQIRMYHDGTEVQVTPGQHGVFEFLAQSVDRTTVSSDETETVTISGPGTAQALNWAMAMPFGWTTGAGGFMGVTGAIQDAFGEQNAAGQFTIDTALWNLCTPNQVSIPGTTATYTQATAPTGTIQVGATWFNTKTNPAVESIWDGNTWVLATNFSGSAGGGSAQVLLTPSGAYLGGGSFTFSNSSFSASVTPAQPLNPAAPGCPIDNDPCNGNDVTQMIMKPAAGGSGYVLIGLTFAEFYCEFRDAAGNVTTHIIGPGRVGGTGAYDSSWAQYWRISCDLQSGGGFLYRFWTSGDGSNWVMQWSFTSLAHAWSPSLVNVFLGGSYNTVGANGAFAQFSSINGEIQANPDNGPIYITTPALAVVTDQIARAGQRGTIPWVSPTFSATQDSDGNPWVDTWSLQVPIGTDLLSATQNYAGAVDAQWVMKPGYKLYCGLNPGKRLQNQIIYHHGEITQYGRTQTRDQIYNIAAATDGSGMIWTEADTSSQVQWAQRETFVSSGGTIDAQSAVNTAAAAVSQWGDEVDARILQIPPNQDGKTVFVDFNVFDWIGIERSDFASADALQVIGITVNIDQDGAESHELIVNTYHQVLAQWFAYLMNKFGGQAASTLGALAPGTTAGSAFTLSVGPNLAISPAQTGGAGSSKAGLMTATSIAATPEVASNQTPAVQVTSGAATTGGSSSGTPQQVIPGSMLTPGSVPATALSFTLPGGTNVTFAASAPAHPNAGDLWYNTSNGNQLSQWTGSVWTAFSFGVGAISATASQLGGVQTYVQSTAPTGSINAGSQWYNTSNGNALNVYIGGSWVLQALGAGAVNFTATSIGGVTVYVQTTAPTGAINTGSLWYDSSNNFELNIYNGTAWTSYQFGTNAIASGSITTGLLAASAVTAAKIAAGTITASQIAANTITASQVASGTITATQIASGTITTTQIQSGTITALDLVSGIVVAGIVDATKIQGATIVADGTSGQFLIYDGPPADGSLIGSWSGFAGTDVFNNSFPAGLSVNQGVITGADIDSTTITNSTIQGDILDGSTISNATITGGSITETTIQFDQSGGQLLVYTSTTTTVTQGTAGDYTITFPTTTDTASVNVWGAGAGGDGGSTSQGGNGGGGGQVSGNNNYGVTGGNTYNYTVGAAGKGQGTGGGHGGSGGDSFFDGSNGIYAQGGNADGTPATGNQGSGTFWHTGGGGGAGSGSGGAGAGGNSANTSTTSGTGNSGAAATSSTGAARPTSQTGSGQGGAGGNSGANGGAASGPGAGGGGAGKGTSGSGTLVKTYNPTWLGSYYGPDAPTLGDELRSTSTMYHGGETASGGSFNGNQRSLMRFAASTIQSDFSTYTPSSCIFTITNEHAYNNSGMTVEFDVGSSLIGTSRPANFPAGINKLGYGGIAEGTTHSYEMGATVAGYFCGNLTDVMGIGAHVCTDEPYNTGFYGYFSSAVTLKITGTKSVAGTTQAGNGTDGQVIISYASGQTLVAAVSPQSGTDQFGNTYVAGISAENIQLYGTNTPATPPSGSSILFNSTGGSPSAITGTGMHGILPVTQGNINGFTRTSSGALCTAWGIPANDANVGTVYRVRVYGDGTHVSGGLVDLFCNGFGTSQAETGFDTLPVASFSFMAEITIAVLTTGATGSAYFSVNGTVCKQGARGDSSSSIAFSGDTASAQTIDTTSATTMFLSCLGLASGESITGQYSTFERIGA